MEENGPQGIWDHIAEKMLLEFAESGCPIFRATTPLSRSKLKSKGHGKLSIHFAADQETIETYHYCIDVSGIIVYLRALQGHSGRNLIDPSLQDNVVIQSGFFQIYQYWMCV